jgi:hypothetical protein
MSPFVAFIFAMLTPNANDKPSSFYVIHKNFLISNVLHSISCPMYLLWNIAVLFLC